MLWAGGLAFAYGGGWLYGNVRMNLKGDPLAVYRNPVRADLPPTVGIRLNNVQIRKYKGKAIETKFRVGQVDVARNRQVFDLFAIHDGVYRQGDQQFAYSANRGNFNGFTGLLTLDGEIRAKSDKFDLTGQTLMYSKGSGELKVASGVRGKAYGGDLKADSIAYNTRTLLFTAGPSTWKGKIPKEFVDADFSQASNRVWAIQSKSLIAKQGNLSTWKDCQASDGEVIVIAPQVTIDSSNNNLVATGGVRYFSAKANTVSKKATILRREKRAIFEGDVKMLVKPKSEEAKGPEVETFPPYTPLPPEKVVAGKAIPEQKDADRVRTGKSIRDFPMIIVGDKVDSIYERGRRSADIFGSPQARQELDNGGWRQVWTYEAHYDIENEILRMKSAPGKFDTRMKNSIGDDLTASVFELSTAEGDDSYSGENIKGSVVSTGEEDDPRGKGQPGPGKGTGGGTTGGGNTGGGTTGGGTTGGGTSGSTSGGTNPPPSSSTRRAKR